MSWRRLLLALGSLAVLAAPAEAAGLCPALPATYPMPHDAQPQPLPYPWWPPAAEGIAQALARVDRGSFALVFVGDSITAGWDPQAFQRHFGTLSPLLLGLGGDRTEGMLYRLGPSPTGLAELAGLDPQLVVLLAGTNNTAAGSPPEDTALGVAELVRLIHARLPRTKILLLGLLPRGHDPTDKLRQVNDRVNALVRRCADGLVVFYADEGARLLDGMGQLGPEMSFDQLHLTPLGYERLAEGLEPEVRRLMGR